MNGQAYTLTPIHAQNRIDYLTDQRDTLLRIITDLAKELGCSADNEEMLQKAHALREDAALLDWWLDNGYGVIKQADSARFTATYKHGVELKFAFGDTKLAAIRKAKEMSE